MTEPLPSPAEMEETAASSPALGESVEGEVPPEPSLEAEAPARGRGCLAFLKETFYTFFLALAFFLLINALTSRVQVLGYSMVPTFRGGEYVLVWRWAYRWKPPRRGDIVVFRREGDRFEYIKRVIGLPGEDVLVQNGRVFVNGQALEEPYIAERPRYQGYWQVPPGHIFVLGDNRNHSTDSHIFGPIPLKWVIGKAVLVYWPPSAWRVLP